MVIRHPPDRSIYMQSLLQFLKGTELKEKKLLENTIIKVLCLSWLHLFICLHLLTGRGRLKVQWDWSLGRLGRLQDEIDNQDRNQDDFEIHLIRMKNAGSCFLPFLTCCCCIQGTFPPELIETVLNKLIQSNFYNSLQKARWPDLEFQMQSCTWNQWSLWPECNWQGTSGIVRSVAPVIERTTLSFVMF